MPEPTIRIERALTISQFHVEKVAGLENKVATKPEYWGVAAKSLEQEKSIEEIRYGSVPDGYYEFVPAKMLDLGYYSVQVAATVHVISAGAFIVARTREGELAVIGVENPERYKDTLLTCLKDSLYFESKVKNVCLTKEYLE